MSTPLLPSCESCGFKAFAPHCANPQCTWLKCLVKTCGKTVRKPSGEDGK